MPDFFSELDSLITSQAPFFCLEIPPRALAKQSTVEVQTSVCRAEPGTVEVQAAACERSDPGRIASHRAYKTYGPYRPYYLNWE